MTNPKTGWITREFEVEAITSKVYAAAGVALFSSIKHPVVSEAYLLNGQTADHGTIVSIGGGVATVIAHDVSFPAQGTVGGTQVATVGPQQFLVAGLNGTQATAQFLVRGR